MLSTLSAFPPVLLEASASQLHDILKGPTLIHLPGRRAPALFVSVLLHGNENTGWDAVRSLLNRYQGLALPRSLSIFIGNVAAAAKGLRRLEDQPDYNRVWPGAEIQALPECAMMSEVLEQMRARGVFASIDVHNNTGLNPHYGCVNALNTSTLHLAKLFSRIVVHFQRPLGVQSMAFSALCPAVTIECGKSGERSATEHAAAFIDAALHLDHFPAHPVLAHDIALYRTIGVVKIPESVTFGFGDSPADVTFVPALDHLNFRDVDIGTPLGRVRAGCALPLEVSNDAGVNVAEDYFELAEGQLRTRRRVLPAMLTLNERVIREDCLCYLMETHPLAAS